MPPKPSTSDDRLLALEKKAQTLETWLKVSFALASFFGLSGVCLAKKADDLTTKYNKLGEQAALLDTDLKTKAQAILQQEVPLALQAGLVQYVRYGDTLYIKAAFRNELMVGLDEGKGVVHTGNGNRAKAKMKASSSLNETTSI